MSNIKSILQRHPLISYFVLAYGISWGGILVILQANGFDLSGMQMAGILSLFGMMLLGPSASCILLTAVLEGRDGFRELRTRLTRWQVGLPWVMIALLTIPVLFLAILSALSILVGPAFTPGFNIIGAVFGLIAGGIEEIGWTGYATPRLLKNHSALKAGLILGILWALWHLLADFSIDIRTMGSGWLLYFFLYWLLPVTAYRVLMTWVYTHTHSLLTAQLMHMSYTGWLYILSPATSFQQGLVWQFFFAAGLWILVGVAALRMRQGVRPAVEQSA